MNELILLSPSHIITVLLSVLAIIFIPQYFKLTSKKAKKKPKIFNYFFIISKSSNGLLQRGDS